MANINNLHTAVANGKQAIAFYKSTSIYQTNAEFRKAVDTLEKQLLDQEQYASSIKESTLFETYLNLPENKLTEANIALVRGDFFKANWILEHLGECAEASKLQEQIYYAKVGRLFETCSDIEADFYRSHLSEKALFGSMASQIKKLTIQMNDVRAALATIDEVTEFNQNRAEKKNTILNAKRQELENKTAALANSENGKDLIARGKAVNKINAITDKMGANLEGSKANQKINNAQEAISKLKAALEDLNSYLSSEQLRKAIQIVDRNTGLFGRAKIDGFVTSKDFKIANMAKQVAVEAGVSKEEIKQEEQEVAQEAEAIDREKEQAVQQEQPQPQVQFTGSPVSSMIDMDESLSDYISDSILFESLLQEGWWDNIKQSAQKIGNQIKTSAQNAYANAKANAKEYFANNTRNALNRTSEQEIRATFEELANKVAVFTAAAKEVQPIFDATGNSKFEIFNRKLGRVLLTAGGIVRLAGIACPPLAAVGTAMAGVGAIANGIGNTRKDAVTGHAVKAGIDVLGGVAGAAMGASAVGKILGQSGDVLTKVSGIGKTLTGAKLTANGINTTKNSSSKLGKGMGVLSAMGGVAMTLSGLSALGAQFSGTELSAEDASKLQQGDAQLQKGAQAIVNDEQVKELTAEKVYLEQNPGAETEHADLLADTIAKQVDNTNDAIAHAKVGDWIIRNDGTKIELKQFDIDYAKAAIGEIKPETNPFDPENPMVGQITQKGHMITDKDMAILRPNNAAVVANQVPQVEEKLPEAPAAPINNDALATDTEPTEGVEELANSPEAVESQLNSGEQETQAAEAASQTLDNEMDEFYKNLQWDENSEVEVDYGNYIYCKANIYGRDYQAIKFDTGVSVCPIFDKDSGQVMFVERFIDKDYLKVGEVVGVPGDKLNLVLVTSLRNSGFTVQFNGIDNTYLITDKTGQIYEPGYRLLGVSAPKNAQYLSKTI